MLLRPSVQGKAQEGPTGDQPVLQKPWRLGQQQTDLGRRHKLFESSNFRLIAF
jgi:hypothetical protein